MKNLMKNILIMGLPIVIGIISSLMGYWEQDQKYFLGKILIIIFLNVIYLIVLLAISIKEAKLIEKAYSVFFEKGKTIIFSLVRNFILQLFSIALSIICSSMGDWNKYQIYFLAKFYSIIFISILYVITIVIFSIIEEKRQNYMDDIFLLRKVTEESIEFANYISEKFQALLYIQHNIKIKREVFEEFYLHIMSGIKSSLKFIGDENAYIEYMKYDDENHKITYVAKAYGRSYDDCIYHELDSDILKDIYNMDHEYKYWTSRVVLFEVKENKLWVNNHQILCKGISLYLAYPLYWKDKLIGMIKIIYYDKPLVLKYKDGFFVNFNIRGLYEKSLLTPFKFLLLFIDAIENYTKNYDKED